MNIADAGSGAGRFAAGVLMLLLVAVVVVVFVAAVAAVASTVCRAVAGAICGFRL